MEVTIGSKKFNLYERIFIQILSLLAIPVLFYPIFFPYRQEHHVSLILISVVILAVFLANLWGLAGLLHIPTGVIIDSETKHIKVKFLLSKPKLISVDDVSNYTSTILSSRFPGILIHLKAGKKIIISEWNLTGYKPIQSFLDENGINNSGKEDFKIFSYLTQIFD